MLHCTQGGARQQAGDKARSTLHLRGWGRERVDCLQSRGGKKNAAGVITGRQQYVEQVSYPRGSAIDRVWVPCKRDTMATGRPLLSVGVTLTA